MGKRKKDGNTNRGPQKNTHKTKDVSKRTHLKAL
jgi:hypothetical protein